MSRPACWILVLASAPALVCATPARAPAQLEGLVALASSPAGKFFLGWAGGKALDLVYDRLTGKPDTADLVRDIDTLMQLDRARAAELYELRRQVAGCATREEVQAAVEAAARRLDARLAGHARRLYELEQARRRIEAEQAKISSDLKMTREDLARLTRRVDENDRRLNAVDRRLDAHGVRLGDQQQQLNTHGTRIGKVEAELDERRQWTHAEIAAKYGRAGADLVDRGDYKEAARYLTQAFAYAPEDPGVSYFMAVAHYLDGNAKDADLWVARGIAAERTKNPPPWFTAALPRVQGRARTWYEAKRNDPVLGVRANFDVRVPGARPAGGVPASDR